MRCVITLFFSHSLVQSSVRKHFPPPRGDISAAILQAYTSISLNGTVVGLYNTQVTLVLAFPRILFALFWWFWLIYGGFVSLFWVLAHAQMPCNRLLWCTGLALAYRGFY